MFGLFTFKSSSPPVRTASTEAPKGLLHPVSAATLLAAPRRQKLLEHIWQRTSLSRAQFTALYRAPIERYAELVQQFPASESHHHAYAGGMLDHGLEIVAYALKLRQSHLLPAGAPPEAQVAQAEAWTACIAYAALLHDIGKIAVDLHVEYADGEPWHPWHGKLTRSYRFRYRKDRAYRLHGAATGLLYQQVLDKPILDWLSTFPELWASLLYVLAGQYERAGILGELVLQADRASVAQELGGDPTKARLAPKETLQRKLLDGIRYLVKEELLKLNQPQASDAWLTGEALWLVSKTACDKLRARLLAQGIDGVPESNTTLFNVLQEHGIVQGTAENKAIWRATVTSASGWTQSFTFLRVPPALIWEPSERPAPFNGAVRIDSEMSSASDAVLSSTSTQAAESGSPADSARASDVINSALSLLETNPLPQYDPSSNLVGAEPDDVPSHEPQVSAADPSRSGSVEPDGRPGMNFVAWLRSGIQTRRLIINDAKALVHTVAGTVFLVSPGVFQRYAQEHPEIAPLAKKAQVADWAWVQKNFEKLRLHRKQDSGLNIWTCSVIGPRKARRVHGYLLTDGKTLIPEVPFDNPYLKLIEAKRSTANSNAG